MFIVLEGIDGCGKDTQLERLFAWIGRKNKYAQIWKTREPSRQTDAGKEISRRLRGEGFRDAREALGLYVRDRAELAPLRREILRHSYVLSSRNDLSTYAYQGLEIPFQEIWDAHAYDSNRIPSPDLTFLLSLTPETVGQRFEERLAKRGEAREFFEQVDFQKRVAANYLDAAKFLESKGRPTVVLDADRSPDAIFLDIAAAIEERACFV